MSLRVNVFYDQSVVCPGDIVSGFVCVDEYRQNKLPLTLNAQNATELASLAIELSCQEHYSYEESTSSTDSEGNTTTTTSTVHRQCTSVQLSAPLQLTEPRSFSPNDAFLPVGKHHFRFAMQLPVDAPASFVGAEEDIWWQARLTVRSSANGRFEAVSKPSINNNDSAVLTVVPRLDDRAPSVDVPLVAASSKGGFVFSSGDVEMRVASPQLAVVVDSHSPASVDVEVTVKNNSSKTIHQISLALVRITGNEHWCTHPTTQLSAARTGRNVCAPVTIHQQKLERGESFALPLTSVALPSTGWPRSQLAAAVGKTVFALFFIRLQIHVAMALDRVVNLPINVLGVARPVHPPMSQPPVADKDAAKGHAAHLDVAAAKSPGGDDDDNGDADDFVKVADGASDGDDDDDGDGDDNDLVAVVDLQGRALVHEVAPRPGALTCTLCKWLAWGSVRVLVRGLANLPRKNIFAAGSDPYVRCDVLDWQNGRTLYSLRTAATKHVTELIADDGGSFAGGVAFNNALLVRVIHSGFVERKIGKLQIAWPTLAALSALRDTDIGATLPPPPPVPTDTAGAPPATISDLETRGVWLPLMTNNKKKASKNGQVPMVCVLLQRFA